MKPHPLLSDQLYMWSVLSDRTHHRRAQATPPAVAAPATAAGLGPSGLADRALQALRQSELQVRSRSRPRAQVLPVGKLPGPLAADGLRPPGRAHAGQPVPGQLHPGSRHPGGDLRDQPRTAASARAALRLGGEFDTLVPHRPHRPASWRDAARQHARGHDRGRPDASWPRGGLR
jgi:hypothetical protein